MKLIKKINTQTNFLISLTFLFILLSFPYYVYSKVYSNEITLRIEGNGIQKILGESILNHPNEVIINGFKKEYIDYSYELENITNVVTIKWNTPLTTCKNMFFNLNNIISIDLSKFDSSKVSDMSSMFYMFYDCQSLKYLDLSYFDTSQVSNMDFLFASCSSLVSLNLSRFNTKSVIKMNSMFKNDESLAIIGQLEIPCKLSDFRDKILESEQAFYNNTPKVSKKKANSNTKNEEKKNSNIYNENNSKQNFLEDYRNYGFDDDEEIDFIYNFPDDNNIKMTDGQLLALQELKLKELEKMEEKKQIEEKQLLEEKEKNN